ncbi:translocon-associated protein subunit alpha [Trichonephila clavata]|uniref:Translocon-associated protein subunit alpha n=1 Tax=Trichonephila clavata TaxID=2740835 RepID=A0A8X6J587_TRICU|nr:translocon-associated protein subunit alpha [Trichonephila clavata]
MFHKKLILILLIVFPISFLCLTNNYVNAQIDLPDEDDDSEADVEDLRPDSDSAVVGGQESFLNEDESDDTGPKASPDADTTFLFTQPSGMDAQLPAGKDVHFLVGFCNKGSKDFIVESMDASFRYPLDFTFHIQNFSAIPYNRVVKPKQDISLYYAFYTSETYSSRPFGLVVNLFYKDADGRQYLDAVYNDTITIVEIDESLDGETFFLYILLAAGLVLLVVVSQQFIVNFTKKKILTGQKIETGTQNHQLDVDYDWLPKETLDSLNKSPRRSERLSPRKSKNQVKNSPKQTTQRRVKRGGKDE